MLPLRRYGRPAVEETRGRDADNKQQHPAPDNESAGGGTSSGTSGEG